jgi:hypothetical protein
MAYRHCPRLCLSTRKGATTVRRRSGEGSRADHQMVPEYLVTPLLIYAFAAIYFVRAIIKPNFNVNLG